MLYPISIFMQYKRISVSTLVGFIPGAPSGRGMDFLACVVCYNMSMLGVIASAAQVADPKYSTIDSNEPFRSLCHGGLGAKLCVELVFKDDPVKRISTEVRIKRDGSHVIASTPETPG